MKNVKFNLWYLPAALLLILLAQSIFVAPRPVSVSYSSLVQMAQANRVERALFTSDEIRFQLKPGTPSRCSASGGRLLLPRTNST